VGATFALQREGHAITVTRQGSAGPWKLLLAGIISVGSVAGGAAESAPQGVIVTPAEDVERVSIAL
jgi:predicted secreted protein